MSDVAEIQGDIQSVMAEIGRKAREAAAILAKTAPDVKNRALLAAAAAIRRNQAEILAANARDMEAAQAQGLTGAILDRLLLNPDRVEGIARGIEAVADLDDPVGKVTETWTRPNGLEISRVRVPLGVIGIIYESRPN
ncbi:MAG TPA: gamma-glutamyl-phosphate reductase, partial [Sphingomonadales bacterium]